MNNVVILNQFIRYLDKDRHGREPNKWVGQVYDTIFNDRKKAHCSSA